MDGKISKKKPRLIAGIVIAAALAVIAVVCVLWKDRIFGRDFDEICARYEEALLAIEEDIEDAGSLIESASVSTNFYDSGEDSFFYVKYLYATIQVTVSDDVEEMTAEEQCSVIHAYQEEIEDLIAKAQEQSGYKSYIKEYMDTDGYVSYGNRHASVFDNVNLLFSSTGYVYTFHHAGQTNRFYVTDKSKRETTQYRCAFINGKLTSFYEKTNASGGGTGSSENDTSGPPYVYSTPSPSPDAKKVTGTRTVKKKAVTNPDASYDDGYEDIYFNDDYDEKRYRTDREYADGVDDAMDELRDDW